MFWKATIKLRQLFRKMIFRCSNSFFSQKLCHLLTQNTDLRFGRGCPDVTRAPSAPSLERFQLFPKSPFAYAGQKDAKHWLLDSLKIFSALFIVYFL